MASGNYYTPLLNVWVKAWGARPTAAMFDTVHVVLGKKPGVEALNLAMMLRPEGVSDETFRAAGTALKQAYGDPKACGSANNQRKPMLAAGIITLERVPGSSPQRLHIKVTDKGHAVAKARQGVTAALRAPGKAVATTLPAKAAKATSKPRKPAKAKVPVKQAPPPAEVPYQYESSDAHDPQLS